MIIREQIIKELKNYFKIQELVGEETYNKHKDNAWFVFDTNLLHCLLILRTNIDKPFTINNWYKGGRFSQRGLRDNTQSILKNKKRLYLSGHVLGKAFDFDVKGMTAEEVRDWIKENEDLLPCKVRLEHRKDGVPINWVHLDTNYYEKNPKIYLFDV